MEKPERQVTPLFTEKLYYQDPYLREFAAKILKKTPLENGRFALILDQTAFYPEGGGQPCDHGSLNEVPVVEVRTENDEIIHITTGDPGDGKIQGHIDWQRRFDHMQQHTGEHILSGILLATYQAENVGFHLSASSCQIDVTLPSLTIEQAAEIEDAANAIIFANLPVEGRFIEAADLSKYSLRKEPGNEFDQIRLVSVQNCDCCPCGGTHVSHTGEVGLFKLRSWEKRKTNIRLDFVCGYRALADYQTKHDLARTLSTKFSAPVEGLVSAVERNVEKLDLCQHELTAVRKLYHEELAARVLSDTEGDGANFTVITRVFNNYFTADLQDFSGRIVSVPNNICLLASTDSGSQRVSFLFSAPSGSPLPMNELMKQALATVSGKGGGNAKQAQGGALDCDPQLVLARALSLLQQ